MKKLDFIFDTDVGNDCDDIMALAYLVYARRHLGVELKAITHSAKCANGIAAIRAFFKHLGEAVPPLGRMGGDRIVRDNYSKAVAERFAEEADFADVPDAVSVLRRALAESENAVICAVGPFTNIAALLESEGDEISPLDGVSLVREKCAKMVLMAGDFVMLEDGTSKPEFNAKVDAPATATVARLCPVPLVFSPFELGLHMLTGKPAMDKYGEDTPLSLAFIRYHDTFAKGGRHSWDPATAVYAVEGCGAYFDDSRCGTVTVDESGATYMRDDPCGMHRILTVKQQAGQTEAEMKATVAAYIDSCAMKAYQA